MTVEGTEAPIQAPSSATSNYHRQIALISGISLLLMTISIMLAQAVGIAGIVVDGDAAITVENILANQGRFRFGIVAHMMVVILDLVVAWALYVFLKPAQEDTSLLAAWFRVAYSIIFGIAVVHMYIIIQLLGDGEYLSVFEASEAQAWVMLSLDAFRDTWDVGYIFFGLHLTLLGLVVLRSGFVPKVFGIILALGGISYVIDYVGLILVPHFGLGTSFIFGWGEPIFMIWLLIRGGKPKLPESS